MHITQIVLKVHDRCNMACSYCYVYDAAAYIPSRVASLTHTTLKCVLGNLVEEYHRGTITFPQEINITFHGGEPTLVGLEAFRDLVETCRTPLIELGLKPRLSITTNGVLFDEAWARFCKSNNIAVAISLDGDASVHDRHRVLHSGRGTHNAVERSVRIAVEHQLNPMLLAVINPSSCPEQTLWYFTTLGVNNVDLLFPETLGTGGSSPVDLRMLSDYLINSFEYWANGNVPSLRVRLYDTVIARLLGREMPNCTLGPGCTGILTIHSDGDISGCDVLGSKVAPGRRDAQTPERTADFLRVLQDTPYGKSACGCGSKPSVCKGCRYWSQCGGYCFATRLDMNGLASEDATTSYCGPLYVLFAHVEAYLRSTLPSLPTHRSGLKAELAQLVGGVPDSNTHLHRFIADCGEITPAILSR